jgi:hypothetical protein
VQFPIHVHFRADGTQIVVVKSPAAHVTLVVQGHLVTVGGVCLTFAATTLSGIDQHLHALGAFAHIVLKRRLSEPPDRPGEAGRIHLRDAIIANDGERSGATRREIATVIYGAEEVANRWSNDDEKLKAVIKRDVLRGRRLIAGGWRDMVAGGTFRAVA